MKYINDAKRFIKARFPEVSERLLNDIRLGKTQKTANRLVVVGPKGGEQPIFKADNTGFMQDFIKRRQVDLGRTADQVISEMKESKRQFQKALQGKQENIEMNDLKSKRQQDELQKLREKRKRAQKRLAEVEKEEEDNEDDASTSLLAKNKRKEEIAKWKQLIKNYGQDIQKLQTEMAETSKTQAQEKAEAA